VEDGQRQPGCRETYAHAAEIHERAARLHDEAAQRARVAGDTELEASEREVAEKERNAARRARDREASLVGALELVSIDRLKADVGLWVGLVVGAGSVD
jgi:hypothetical protein